MVELGQQPRLNASLSESALNFLKKQGKLIINNKLCVQHVEKILFMFYLHSTHCFTMSIKHSPKFINALSERLDFGVVCLNAPYRFKTFQRIYKDTRQLTKPARR